MHEFALYGLVHREKHQQVLQQLAGVTRMQPHMFNELHLVFKAQAPLGLSNIPSAGGSQGVILQDIQRVKAMLSSSLYYIQIVGELPKNLQPNGGEVENASTFQTLSQNNSTKWHLDFNDIPDPGKQVVSTRLSFRIPIEDGNVMEFMKYFGYDYVSRYLVTGSKFYDQDTTLFLHRVLQIPQAQQEESALDNSFLQNFDQLQPLDGTGGYLLQASIEAVDGNNPELRDKATRQLLTMKESLSTINFTPGDRLALDTRILAVNRRV